MAEMKHRRKDRLTVEDIEDLIENRLERNKARAMEALYQLGNANRDIEQEAKRVVELVKDDKFISTPGGQTLSKITGHKNVNEKALLLMESLLYNMEYSLLDITEAIKELTEKIDLLKDIDKVIEQKHINLLEE